MTFTRLKFGGACLKAATWPDLRSWAFARSTDCHPLLTMFDWPVVVMGEGGVVWV